MKEQEDFFRKCEDVRFYSKQYNYVCHQDSTSEAQSKVEYGMNHYKKLRPIVIKNSDFEMYLVCVGSLIGIFLQKRKGFSSYNHNRFGNATLFFKVPVNIQNLSIPNLTNDICNSSERMYGRYSLEKFPGYSCCLDQNVVIFSKYNDNYYQSFQILKYSILNIISLCKILFICDSSKYPIYPYSYFNLQSKDSLMIVNGEVTEGCINRDYLSDSGYFENCLFIKNQKLYNSYKNDEIRNIEVIDNAKFDNISQTFLNAESDINTITFIPNPHYQNFTALGDLFPERLLQNVEISCTKNQLKDFADKGFYVYETNEQNKKDEKESKVDPNQFYYLNLDKIVVKLDGQLLFQDKVATLKKQSTETQQKISMK